MDCRKANGKQNPGLVNLVSDSRLPFAQINSIQPETGTKDNLEEMNKNFRLERCSVAPRNFLMEQPKKVFISVTFQLYFPETFCKWKTTIDFSIIQGIAIAQMTQIIPHHIRSTDVIQLTLTLHFVNLYLNELNFFCVCQFGLYFVCNIKPRFLHLDCLDCLRRPWKSCRNTSSLRSWRFFGCVFPFVICKVKDSAVRKLNREQKKETMVGRQGEKAVLSSPPPPIIFFLILSSAFVQLNFLHHEPKKKCQLRRLKQVQVEGGSLYIKNNFESNKELKFSRNKV